MMRVLCILPFRDKLVNVEEEYDAETSSYSSFFLYLLRSQLSFLFLSSFLFIVYVRSLYLCYLEVDEDSFVYFFSSSFSFLFFVLVKSNNTRV